MSTTPALCASLTGSRRLFTWCPRSSRADPGEKKRTVTVESIVDEEGGVRMPSVSRANVGSPYAASALDAVKQWRFRPPLHQAATLVLCGRKFNFVPAVSGGCSGLARNRIPTRGGPDQPAFHWIGRVF